MARVKDLFYFYIEVREGAPGYADNEWYTSDGYKTFQEAYTALVRFEIGRHWPQLRSVRTISIWKEGKEHVDVKTTDNGINIDDLHLLGVTEEEYDELLAELKVK